MEYSKMTPKELEMRIQSIKNTELFVDLIIERNNMLAKGEINNPIYRAYEEEIMARKMAFQEEKKRSKR